MARLINARTPFLALILFVFSIAYGYAANRVVVIPLAADPAPALVAAFDGGDQTTFIYSTTNPATIVRQVSLTAPAGGVVIVNSTANIKESAIGDGVECSITTASSVDSSALQKWISPGGSAHYTQLSGTRGFNVEQGITYDFKLLCTHTGSLGSSTARDASLTVLFTPSA